MHGWLNKWWVQVDLASGAGADQFGQLFAEELGLVLEVNPTDEQQVLQAYTDAGLPAHVIGTVTADAKISISVNKSQQISGGTAEGLNMLLAMQHITHAAIAAVSSLSCQGISACCQHACCFECLKRAWEAAQ